MGDQQFLIVAGDVDGNLGDAAIAASLTEAIKQQDSSASVRVVSEPRAQSPINADGYLRRGLIGLPALVSAAAQSDTVICGGGGLFQDDDSLIKMPYWAVRLATLRPFARRLIGFSIGAGPLDVRTSRIAARAATALLDEVTVRDGLARAALQPHCKQAVDVVPDPAFMLAPAADAEAEKRLIDADVPLDEVPLIGVAIRRCFNARRNLIPHQLRARLGLKPMGQERMARLCEQLAYALGAVIREAGAYVVFLPSYRGQFENDTAVCEQIASGLPTGTSSVLEISDPRLYKAITGRMDALLAGRMHPVILAAAMGTPSVALAYNPKFRGTLELLGQSQRVLEVDDLVANGDARELASMLIGAMNQDVAARTRLKNAAARLAEQTRRNLWRALQGEEAPSGELGRYGQ